MLTRLPAFFLFFLTALFLGACSEAARTVPMFSGQIDPFEDSDLVNQVGQPWESIAEGPMTSVDAYIESGGYSSNSRFHLSISGSRPVDATGAQVAGIRSLLTENATAEAGKTGAARDVTPFSGVAFWIRGSVGSFIVQLGTAAVTDFDYYNSYIEIGEEWNEFRIPFSEFRQEGFGVTRSWTGRDVTHIAFYANLTGSFSLEIDDVHLYSE